MWEMLICIEDGVMWGHIIFEEGHKIADVVLVVMEVVGELAGGCSRVCASVWYYVYGR